MNRPASTRGSGNALAIVIPFLLVVIFCIAIANLVMVGENNRTTSANNVMLTQLIAALP